MGASPTAPEFEQNALVKVWHAFTVWRRSRPFWAGFWTVLSAVELWIIPFLFTLMTQGTLNLKTGGIAGISTMMIAPMMILMAVTMWFAPSYRVFAGVFVLICSLLALNVSNFGGFLFGTLLGVIGGGLAFSWTPQLSPEQMAAQERATEAYRQALTGETPETATAAAAPIAFPYAVQDAVPRMPEAAEWAYAAQQPQPETTLADPLNTRAAADSGADVPPPLPSAEDTPLGA